MLTFKLVLCGLLASVAVAQPGPKTAKIVLPKRANIVVDGRFKEGDQGSANSYCKEVNVTPKSVAQRLQSFHEISDQDLHDYYDFVDCGTKGRILLDGKTFPWTLYITDEIDTTFPDGRLKRLAGKVHPVH